MTAQALADMLSARPAGRGRWLAKCPGHADRHPSLTITQGHSGVLLKCRSHNCSIESIVTALGLPLAALFDSAQLTPEQRQQAAQAKAIRDAQQARQRAIDREQCDRIYRLEKLMDALGAKLIRNPDNRELGRLFHLTCERLHDAETNLRHPEDGPLRLPEPSTVLGWIADALMGIGQTFDAKETARSEQAA